MDVDDRELELELERLQQALGLEDEPERTIDRFRILSQLGKGGMGIVYAAEDPSLGRRVALKLVRPRLPGARRRLQQRLVREARALGRLNHPNVVHVYEVGSDGDELFVAMELVDGPTLLDWQAERSRSLDELLDVYLQAAAGLAAAHDAGLVHRDFKPENVFVSSDGRVLVGDFGLANLDETILTTFDGEPSEPNLSEPNLTEAGTVLGTLGYMAPEQLRGDDLDARVDQFGFCVALWEAITHERPFVGTTAEALLEAIERGQPRGAERVPRRLRAILQRGFAHEREDRFGDLRELIGAIGSLDRRRSRWRRVLGVIAIAAAATTLWMKRDVSKPCAERQQLDQLWARGRADLFTQLERSSAGALKGRADRAVERLQAEADAVCREPREGRRVVLRRAIDQLAAALAEPEALTLSGWAALIDSLETLDLDRPAIDLEVAAAIDRSRLHEWYGRSQPAWEAADEAVRLALAAAPRGWSASASEALIQRGRMFKDRLEHDAALVDYTAAEAHAEGAGYTSQVLRARLEAANVLVKFDRDPDRGRLALTRLQPPLIRHSWPLDRNRALAHELRSTLAARSRQVGLCVAHGAVAVFIHAVVHYDPVALARAYSSLAVELGRLGVGDVEPLYEYSAALLHDELPEHHGRRDNIEYNRALLALDSADEDEQAAARATLHTLHVEGDRAARLLAARALFYDAQRRDDLRAIRALLDELQREAAPSDPQVLMGRARLGELDAELWERARSEYVEGGELEALARLEHDLAGSHWARACDFALAGRARLEEIEEIEERENLRPAFERLLTSLDCDPTEP